MGLKLGAYTSNGTLTCEDLPASLGREQYDAYTLAKWGIEYFKYDYCHHIPVSKYAPLVYSISISQFDGHPIEYSVHNAVLGGLARFMTDTKLPSGSYVSGLDANLGSITYNNIEVDEDGEYVLTVNIKNTEITKNTSSQKSTTTSNTRFSSRLKNASTLLHDSKLS